MAMGYLLGTTQSSADCDPFTDPDCNGASAPIGFYEEKVFDKKEEKLS